MLLAMETDRVSRVVRALRHRRGLTQEELALRARTSASVISRIECGRLTECSLEAVDAALTALDARLVVDVRWRGGELDRLLDADHASLEEQWHRRLTAWHWLVRDEVSFNEYGDRGRIDLLGWHPGTRTLLVNELKSGIYEMQSLFGTLDVKERLAPVIARRFGWKPERVVVCLVLGEGRTTRRRVVEHAALFSRFDRRGRSAFAWAAAANRAGRRAARLPRFVILPPYVD
jgi:transcriptional regulator with XRE-family HTH domain